MKEVMVVDEQTELEPVRSTELDTFAGISKLRLNKKETETLLALVKPEEIDILPTGEIYMPQVHYRRRLLDAFGPGRWALRPLDQPSIRGELAIQPWALYVKGHFVAYAVGEADYIPSNERMTWGDVLETLKSNALMRVCKDLGIAAECWDKRFTEVYQRDHCVKVWRQGKNKPEWRRIDAEPFWNETGIAEAKVQEKAEKKAQPKKKQATQKKKTNGRPLNPETLLAYLKQRAASKAGMQNRDASPKQASLVAQLWEQCFAPAKDSKDKYHDSLIGAFEVESATQLTMAQASAVIDWLKGWEGDDIPDSGAVPHKHAVTEAQALYKWLMKQEGQQELSNA